MDINRFNFTKAAVKRAIKGVNPPTFMKYYDFDVKGDKLFHEGKVIVPNEERDDYLRKALYANKSTKPFGRDSLHYVIMKEAINISRRDIEKFLKAQNVIVSRTARPKQEKRAFYSSISKAGVCSGDLAHIRPEDLPDEYMPSRQDDDSDTEWKPGMSDKAMKNIWKSGTKGDRFFYNLVDIYTGWLETIVVGTKDQHIIAKATKKLVARMGKALGTPVTVVRYDMGGEFVQSIKDLEKSGVKVFQMRTNAVVEQVNAKLQRIFYTIVAQKRTGFAGSVKQAVDISNNTKNRKLGMTPKEAVAQLRAGEKPAKKRGKTNVAKNVYPEGTIVRALKKKREKAVTGYKAYKGAHYTQPKQITKVSFHQGHPKYTLDGVGANKKGVSMKKWHDQLVPVRRVDKKSRDLVSRRENVVYRRGDNIWFNYKGKKLIAKIKKREKGKWRINYKWTDGKFLTLVVDEDDFEPRAAS
jgi:hypothetical protein